MNEIAKMETDPGESTDYNDFPSEKPFINSPSKSDLRLQHELDSPPPIAIPMTNSASILSALESLQSKIKELEINREKTLLDIEQVTKKMDREGTSPSPCPPSSTQSETCQQQENIDTNLVLNLDSGEKFSQFSNGKSKKDILEDDKLPSNPSTPRNVKEASLRSTAIGKRLQLVEKEYGSMSSSLNNLRALATKTSAAEKENNGGAETRILRRESSVKRRIGEDGRTLMALQNLEKERASLKISQSLAEARIRALEKELESNRQKSSTTTTTTTLAKDGQVEQNFIVMNYDTGSDHRLHGNSVDDIPVDDNLTTEPKLPPSSEGPSPIDSPLDHPYRNLPNDPLQRCTCDHRQQYVGVRRGRERLCQMKNRLNHERAASKSPGGRITPEKSNSRCHYRLNMKHVPFVVGQSTSASHSLTANIQTLVAKMKTHDSGLCEHIRQLHEPEPPLQGCDDVDESPPTSVNDDTPLLPPPPPTTTTTPPTTFSDPSIVADQLREVNAVLDALQDEFAAMSFEHHELTNKLKALGVDDYLTTEDVRSASQNVEIVSLETQLGDLVARMNVKGKQIKVLKKILKGIKEKNPKITASSSTRVESKKTKSSPTKMRTRTKSRKSKEVQLGSKGQRVDVQEGIMVQCIPSTARGARDLLYGIKDLHRTLKEADISWQ